LLDHGHLEITWLSLLWALSSHLQLLWCIKVPFALNFSPTCLGTAVRISLILPFLFSALPPVPSSAPLPRRHGGHHHRHVKPVVTAPFPSEEQSKIWQLKFLVLFEMLLLLC